MILEAMEPAAIPAKVKPRAAEQQESGPQSHRLLGKNIAEETLSLMTRVHL